MMNPGRLLISTFLAIFSSGVATSPAQTLEALKGNCAIAVSTRANKLELLLERGTCPAENDRDRLHDRDARKGCHSSQNDEPFDAFNGFVVSDLGRDGAHIEAVLNAEAGTLTCSGTIHNFKLTGDLTFTPNAAFAAHMLKLGIQGITSENLQAYTLFQVTAAKVEALLNLGVTGIDAHNLNALSIFHVDPPFVESIRALGYPTPPAEKLVALKIHGVTPEEVKQVRTLGYQPTLDELIQMRIFKITPAFIQDMRARGFGFDASTLTIAKLVKIRISKITE
jgi:hypothetical protein